MRIVPLPRPPARLARIAAAHAHLAAARRQRHEPRIALALQVQLLEEGGADLHAREADAHGRQAAEVERVEQGLW